MHSDFFSGIDSISNFGADIIVTDGKFGQGSGAVVLVDSVDLLSFGLGDSKRFDGTNGLLTSGESGVLDLAVFIGVAALAFINPELLRYGVLHGAGISAPHFVVGDPAVLGSAFAVFGEFGGGVDSTLRVVVFDPADMAQMTHIQVESLGGDASGDNAVELVGFDLGVKQAIAESRSIEHGSLAAGDNTVAL